MGDMAQPTGGLFSSGWINAGLLLTVFGGLIYYLKEIPSKIVGWLRRRLVYTVKVYQYDELFYILEKWLYSHHQRLYRDVEACISENEFSSNRSEPVQRRQRKRIAYRQEDTVFTINYKGKNILFTKNKEKTEKAGTSLRDMFFSKYVITGWRAKEYITQLLEEVMDFNYAEEDENYIRVYSNTSYGSWEMANELVVKGVDKIILNKELKDRFLSDVQEFMASKGFYTERGIPYKRGYLLYGPPGNGKTSLCLSIAAMLKRDVYSISLNGMDSDTDLKSAFSNLRADSILLIEDVDKIFKGREAEQHKITFSAFLNCMDGAFYKQGIITLITTNHIDQLDEALLRKGRVDMQIEIPNPCEQDIITYMSMFYSDAVYIEINNDVCMAAVQEICIRNRNDKEQAVSELNNI